MVRNGKNALSLTRRNDTKHTDVQGRRERELEVTFRGWHFWAVDVIAELQELVTQRPVRDAPRNLIGYSCPITSPLAASVFPGRL